MKIFKSIILCTYNEANCINEAIENIQNKLNNTEIIIIDDNSNDGTIEKINQFKNQNNIKSIIRKKNKGLASALTRGIMESKGEYIGWLDTNMSYLCDKFNEMEELISNENYDIVLLSRYVTDGKDERPLTRSLASKYLNLFCKFVFNSKINDFTSGIFLMKREILNEVSIFGNGHGEFFIEFLYNVEKKGFKISEIPYIQKKDLDPIKSKSAPNLFKFLYLGMFYVFRIFLTFLRKN